MNREIKFRAWQDNQMLTSPISSNYGLTRFFGFLYEDTPIMQYTGLKDKNSTPIYEGDHFGNPQFYVHFNNGMYCLGGVPLIDYLNGNTLEKIEEVKGNIYENPELLK